MRIIDTCLIKERLATQSRYCTARNATLHLKQTGHCGHCGKGNCPICALSYASAVRTMAGREFIQRDRKATARRRFDEFVDGGQEETKSTAEERTHSLFLQLETRRLAKKQDCPPPLPTIGEYGTLKEHSSQRRH